MTAYLTRKIRVKVNSYSERQLLCQDLSAIKIGVLKIRQRFYHETKIESLFRKLTVCLTPGLELREIYGERGLKVLIVILKFCLIRISRYMNI